MSARTILIVIQLLLSTNAFGQSVDFDKFPDRYLTELESSQTAVLYTACKTQTGKAVLMFSLDGKQGRILELKNGKMINTAPLNITHQSATIDISETQGGLYTYTVIENHVKDLLDRPFTFVSPENVKKILAFIPSYECIDKPPKY